MDLTGDLVLSVFQAGLHGAALVFLYLGYRLNRQVVEEDGPQLKAKLASVRFFLVVALAFFVAGAGLQVWEERTDGELTMHLSPKEMPDGVPDLELLWAGEPLAVERGYVKRPLAEATDLRIDAEDLRDAVVSLQAVNRRLQVDEAASDGEEVGVTDTSTGGTGVSNDQLATADDEELEAAARNLSSSLADPAVQDPAAVKASLGWVEFNRGNTKEAVRFLEEAAREAPDEKTRARALNNLGRVHLQQGDLEASREAFELVGESPAAKKGLTLVDAAERAVQRSERFQR